MFNNHINTLKLRSHHPVTVMDITTSSASRTKAHVYPNMYHNLNMAHSGTNKPVYDQKLDDLIAILNV